MEDWAILEFRAEPTRRLKLRQPVERADSDSGFSIPLAALLWLFERSGGNGKRCPSTDEASTHLPDGTAGGEPKDGAEGDEKSE